MKYITIPPPPHLAKYVRCFWILESDEPYLHRHYADGSAEMIFHYKGKFEEITDQGNISQSYAMIHAQSKNFKRFTATGGFEIFGVYLYPFAIPYLCNMPSSALSNEMPDLVTIFGNEGRILEEQMMLAQNNNERLKIITQFLEKRFQKSHKTEAAIFYCISQVIHTKGLTKVEKLAYNCFLSTRQFERKFKEFSGFSPKLYTRIIRFQETLKEYGNKSKSLTQIAYDCGYYDQSHFIHEFKEFSGYHPKQYFSGNPEGVDYRQV